MSAYDKGFSAAKAGVPYWSNPFERDTGAFHMWLKGYEAGL